MRLMIFCSIASPKIKVLLSEKGKSYIKQLERKKLLFVRELKSDADGFTRGYAFLGSENFVEFFC